MRGQYTSALDLIMATSDLAGRLRNWNVLEEESLSDHCYIICQLQDTRERNKKKGRVGIKPTTDALNKNREIFIS